MSLSALLQYGCKPYIATSSHLVSSFNLEPFGTHLSVYFDGQEQTNFHLAYMRANSIAFDADLGMPNWVYIDFVLLQTGVVGFMLPREKLPRELKALFERDPLVKIDELDFVPISGQTAGLAADGKTWTGVSLFSLAKHLPDIKNLGLAVHTRAMALAVYKAKHFVGITQYDNPAVAIHGKTTKGFFIKQPCVWIHPRTHMTFVYEQEIDYSLDALHERPPEPFSFLLRADDLSKKESIAQGIASGKRYKIVSPFRIVKGGEVFLPILELD